MLNINYICNCTSPMPGLSYIYQKCRMMMIIVHKFLSENLLSKFSENYNYEYLKRELYVEVCFNNAQNKNYTKLNLVKISALNNMLIYDLNVLMEELVI
jgi:hypothetical protein